ncbi:MAG: hypothetical protein DLM60_22765 [Pseudonocardiales bacterium]|nr:MAG: hypothetical protein DLM60_22765 [Pseudonocardiales bacterium]
MVTTHFRRSRQPRATRIGNSLPIPLDSSELAIMDDEPLTVNVAPLGDGLPTRWADQPAVQRHDAQPAGSR